ncbi:30716_t:CDS:2, partial [Gigaspora margarita]
WNKETKSNSEGLHVKDGIRQEEAYKSREKKPSFRKSSHKNRQELKKLNMMQYIKDLGKNNSLYVPWWKASMTFDPGGINRLTETL